jgi:hypothetical protein
MHTELMDDLVAALCQSRDRNEQGINLTCKSTFTFTFFAFAVHSGDASVNKIKDDVRTRSVHTQRVRILDLMLVIWATEQQEMANGGIWSVWSRVLDEQFEDGKSYRLIE